MRNDFKEGAFLAHSAKGTSWKKGTKYIKKVPLGGGRFYYIYNQAQLDALNKKNSGAVNVLSNKERQKRLSAATKAVTVEDLAKNGFKVSGKTAADKTKNLQKSISKGEQQIQKALEKSKKSRSGGSSGSSSKKSGGGSGKSSSKEKAAKEKSAAKGTAKKEAKEKTTKETKKKAVDNTPINMDTLKKIYGVKDEDVTKHDMTASEFKNKMLSKYDEGSFGYLMAGDKAYKWTINGGQLILKDFNSDKDVSFDTYLKDVKSFQEFQTNKKKKK